MPELIEACAPLERTLAEQPFIAGPGAGLRRLRRSSRCSSGRASAARAMCWPLRRRWMRRVRGGRAWWRCTVVWAIGSPAIPRRSHDGCRRPAVLLRPFQPALSVAWFRLVRRAAIRRTIARCCISRRRIAVVGRWVGRRIDRGRISAGSIYIVWIAARYQRKQQQQNTPAHSFLPEYRRRPESGSTQLPVIAEQGPGQPSWRSRHADGRERCSLG